MPHVHLGRASRRCFAHPRRQTGIERYAILIRSGLNLDQPQVDSPLQQPPADRPIHQRQRMQPLEIALPRHPPVGQDSDLVILPMTSCCRVCRVFDDAPRGENWGTRCVFATHSTRHDPLASLAEKRHLRPLDMHHRLGEPHPLDRLAHLDPRHRAVEIMPDQPAAGRQGSVGLAAIVQHVLQVVRTVDERKLDWRDPAEVIAHRVGRDEERLVGRAEMVGEPAPVGMAGHFNFLLDRTGCGPRHAADQLDREDPGIRGRPPRQVRRHVPEPRADLQHSSRPGMHQQREHHPRIILPGIPAERPANIRASEPLREIRPAHGQHSRRDGRNR